MKKLMIIAVILLSSSASNAQVIMALIFGDKLNNGNLEFGLTLGENFSKISNYQGKGTNTFNLGLFLNIKLSDKFYLHPEAIPKNSYRSKDFIPYSTGDPTLDNLFANGTAETKINVITTPLLVRYRIYKQFYIDAGPEIDLRTKAKDIFKVTVNENKLENTIDVSDNYTRLSVLGAAGITWRFKDLTASTAITIRYYNGFTDINKQMQGNQSANGWYLNIMFPVGANKKKKTGKEQ